MDVNKYVIYSNPNIPHPPLTETYLSDYILITNWMH